jgi:AcrR family transcriptional regulator
MDQPAPSKRRYEKTRQGILAAARAILRENGVEGLSIRALAERVDYSPSAIYQYFDSKESILDALREEGWQLRRAMNAGMDLSGKTPMEILIAAGMNYLRFARTYPEHFKLMFSSQYARPQELGDIINNPEFSGLSRWIEAGIEAGEIELPEGVSVLHVRMMLWFVAHGASIIEINMLDSRREEFEKTVLDVFHAMAKLMAPKG